MNSKDLTTIKAAFNAMAKTAGPNETIWIGTKELSLKEYAREIQNETPIGKGVLQDAERCMTDLNCTAQQFADTLTGNNRQIPKP